ncbi:AraC-type DNA-binding protein [Monaibacterium marinum]|uniref:AraC-type DNA-binding protein n=1 Tax=Pontivivens marinum TaxID=1690039 RepID=A0A2C9CQ96_9RHOB|nr:AraC family transcriptional regulator [Monaibacterium marinum]SOH93390.1 AraC-type DNA-binding protein [Monaibacterium marinum]
MPNTKIFISTEMVDERHRNDFWFSVVSPIFEPSLIQDSGDKTCKGVIKSKMIGSLSVSSSEFNAQSCLRNKRSIIKSEIDSYIFQMYTSGSFIGDFDGKISSVQTGDICIVDPMRLLKGDATSGSTLTIVAPRDMIDREARGALHGMVLRSHDPATRMLSSFMQGLQDVSNSIKKDVTIKFEDAFTKLVSANMHETEKYAATPTSLFSSSLRERVLDYIDLNLLSSDICVEGLMRRFRVSRAQLYRVFAQDGGIAKLIRDRRLDVGYEILSNSKFSDKSIEFIALYLGFSSSSQFIRAFKTRFDCTPSVIRTESISRGASFKLHDHFKKFI